MGPAYILSGRKGQGCTDSLMGTYT